MCDVLILGCNKPHMVDYMIWPWFERMEALPVLYGSEAQIPVDRFPNLVLFIYLLSYFNIKIFILDELPGRTSSTYSYLPI